MRFFRHHPPAALALGFVILIAVGALLLLLPAATSHPIRVEDAVFTATSAVALTGLSVVGMTEFTTFGQVVIVILIQLGGLGFMTFAVLAMRSLHLRLGATGQEIAQEALGDGGFNKLVETARAVLFFSLFFEALGIIVLTLALQQESGWAQAAYDALFYSVSAFNNAGIPITPENLAPYGGNVVINLTLTVLIIAGGLGFLVLLDISRHRRWRALTVNSRLVILTTLMLNVVGFVLIWLMERNNPHTLLGMPWQEQALHSWFQAVTPRTAGFNTLPLAQMTDGSTFLMIVLMLIGGGSLSTAGGIKVGTFAVLLLTTWSFVRRQEQVNVFGHTIPEHLVKKALAVTSISFLMVALAVYTLLVIEHEHGFTDVVFEVISALSTVGLSRGITTSLSNLGEAVIIFMMFAGRLGPLTLAYFIALPKIQRTRYRETHIDIG